MDKEKVEEQVENKQETTKKETIKDKPLEEEITIHSVKRYGIYDNQVIAQISVKNSYLEKEGIFPYFLDLDNPDVSERHRKVIDLIKENNIDIEPSDSDKVSVTSALTNEKIEYFLKETEKYIQPDYPVSDSTRKAVEKYRKDLKSLDIQKQYPEDIVWPNMPKIVEIDKSSDEYKSNQIRAQRDQLLDETDKFMTIDSILSDDEIKELKEYRKSLRDISLIKSFPNVSLPTLPKFLQENVNGKIEYVKKEENKEETKSKED